MNRYLGNKKALTGEILKAINKYTSGVTTSLDVFAGTGSVAISMKEIGMNVMANDALYFSFVQNKAQMEMNDPISHDLKERIEFLNSDALMAEPPCEIEEAFIYQNYSPHDSCTRKYFQVDNALRIDYMRLYIEKWKKEISEADYFYLLKILIDAVPEFSNTTGTFDAYLKKWDSRACKPLRLAEAPVTIGATDCKAYNMDALAFASTVSADIAYLDPPYCSRQYNSNYHLLETIARYDSPQITDNITGKRIDPEKKSAFCSKTKAFAAFEQLFCALDVRYILLSYNNDSTSVLTTEEMSSLMRSCGKADTFKLMEIPYKRYQSKKTDSSTQIVEQIYFIEK